jgi:hypothetical protein
VCGFLTRIIATHAGISPSDVSTEPYDAASTTYGMLPYQTRPKARIQSFGTRLESRLFSAPDRLTSELLRFL